MIVLSEKTAEMASALAARDGVSLDDAVALAVEARARQLGPAPRRRQSVEEMLAVGLEISRLPLLDQRSPEDIMDDLDVP